MYALFKMRIRFRLHIPIPAHWGNWKTKTNK